MALRNYLAVALVSGALALSATSAGAVTFNEVSSDSDGPGSVSFVSAGETATATFDWDDTPFNAFVEFTSTSLFNFFLSSFETDLVSSDVSAFRLIGPGDVTISRTDLSCNNGLPPLQGSCQLVTAAANTGGLADDADKPDQIEPLFAALASGTYTLAFLESNAPAAGTATFTVAAIPLPAGLALLLGGLGVLGFASRRKA